MYALYNGNLSIGYPSTKVIFDEEMDGSYTYIIYPMNRRYRIRLDGGIISFDEFEELYKNHDRTKYNL